MCSVVQLVQQWGSLLLGQQVPMFSNAMLIAVLMAKPNNKFKQQFQAMCCKLQHGLHCGM